MMPVKPKLRLGPDPVQMAEQQKAAERLLQLEPWTEEPANQAASVLTPPPAPVQAPAIPSAATPPSAVLQAVFGPPVRPWQGADPAVIHSYNIMMPKPLHHKVDWVWKRQGYKSMKAYVQAVLERDVDRALAEMGELL